ncbi:hypothetical protein HQ584_05340, partial [Patescibacteria group bacterium]|nr:hypothetical protein [Patescibacteria group bacterium]
SYTFEQPSFNVVDSVSVSPVADFTPAIDTSWSPYYDNIDLGLPKIDISMPKLSTTTVKQTANGGRVEVTQYPSGGTGQMTYGPKGNYTGGIHVSSDGSRRVFTPIGGTVGHFKTATGETKGLYNAGTLTYFKSSGGVPELSVTYAPGEISSVVYTDDTNLDRIWQNGGAFNYRRIVPALPKQQRESFGTYLITPASDPSFKQVSVNIRSPEFAGRADSNGLYVDYNDNGTSGRGLISPENSRFIGYSYNGDNAVDARGWSFNESGKGVNSFSQVKDGITYENSIERTFDVNEFSITSGVQNNLGSYIGVTGTTTVKVPTPTFSNPNAHTTHQAYLQGGISYDVDNNQFLMGLATRDSRYSDSLAEVRQKSLAMPVFAGGGDGGLANAFDSTHAQIINPPGRGDILVLNLDRPTDRIVTMNNVPTVPRDSVLRATWQSVHPGNIGDGGDKLYRNTALMFGTDGPEDNQTHFNNIPGLPQGQRMDIKFKQYAENTPTNEHIINGRVTLFAKLNETLTAADQWTVMSGKVDSSRSSLFSGKVIDGKHQAYAPITDIWADRREHWGVVASVLNGKTQSIIHDGKFLQNSFGVPLTGAIDKLNTPRNTPVKEERGDVIKLASHYDLYVVPNSSLADQELVQLGGGTKLPLVFSQDEDRNVSFKSGAGLPGTTLRIPKGASVGQSDIIKGYFVSSVIGADEKGLTQLSYRGTAIGTQARDRISQEIERTPLLHSRTDAQGDFKPVDSNLDIAGSYKGAQEYMGKEKWQFSPTATSSNLRAHTRGASEGRLLDFAVDSKAGIHLVTRNADATLLYRGELLKQDYRVPVTGDLSKTNAQQEQKEIKITSWFADKTYNIVARPDQAAASKGLVSLSKDTELPILFRRDVKDQLMLLSGAGMAGTRFIAPAGTAVGEVDIKKGKFVSTLEVKNIHRETIKGQSLEVANLAHNYQGTSEGTLFKSSTGTLRHQNGQFDLIQNHEIKGGGALGETFLVAGKSPWQRRWNTIKSPKTWPGALGFSWQVAKMREARRRELSRATGLATQPTLGGVIASTTPKLAEPSAEFIGYNIAAMLHSAAYLVDAPLAGIEWGAEKVTGGYISGNYWRNRFDYNVAETRKYSEFAHNGAVVESVAQSVSKAGRFVFGSIPAVATWGYGKATGNYRPMEFVQHYALEYGYESGWGFDMRDLSRRNFAAKEGFEVASGLAIVLAPFAGAAKGAAVRTTTSIGLKGSKAAAGVPRIVKDAATAPFRLSVKTKPWQAFSGWRGASMLQKSHMATWGIVSQTGRFLTTEVVPRFGFYGGVVGTAD